MNVQDIKRATRSKTKTMLKLRNFLSTLVLLFVVLSPVTALAQSSSELQNRIDRLNAQIEQQQSELNNISNQADTLENKLRAIEAEIASLQASIDKANLQIRQTRDQIDEAIEKLQAQKRIMFENARVLYKMGNPSTIEILASSDNFTEFINRQEYLETIKDTVNKAAQEIIALKDQLESKQKELEEFVKQQEIQKQIIDNKRAEQAELLAQTRGEEARYQARVANLAKQRRQAENELIARIQAGSLQGGNGAGTAVKSGQVLSAGQLVGYVGDSGFAEGAHLHFVLIEGSNYQDPTPYLNSGVEWPVPGYRNVSQPYGCVNNTWYNQGGCPPGQSFHRGLDIAAPPGARAVATEAGVVSYSGCWAGSGFGNVVIVDHASGRQTYYPHLGSGCR